MLAVATCCPIAVGQLVVRDGFETPEAKWGEPNSQGPFRLERHEPARDQIHSGLASELVTISAQTDRPVFVAYPIRDARLIDELGFNVWVRSDRAGIELAARVVLPRTLDLRSGDPLTTVLVGTRYTAVGSWQPLSLGKLSASLDSQVPLLRSRLGPQVDVREAYIDQLLLNVSGGRGTTNVWIDDLQITGLVAGAPTGIASFRAGLPAAPVANSNPPNRRVPQIQRSGPALLVGGRPLFPRIITHQGEPLEFLRDLGFNVIKLSSPPTAALSRQAEALGLWFLSPPPRLEAELPPAPESPGLPPPPLGPQFDRVLAWDLGQRLTTRDLDLVKATAEALRVRDRELSRPLVCGAESDLRRFTWNVDFLVLDRSPIGSSLELTGYATWLRERPRLAHPGCGLWAAVQTEPAAELLEQVTLLTRRSPASLSMQSEQIKLVAYTALAGGARGLWFQSRTRLDGRDAAARLRARTLELLNLELMLVEPWAATSNFVTSIVGSDPNVLAAVFESDRSHIVLPIYSGAGAQFVPGQLAGTNVSFRVPGVPESTDAYEVTPADLPHPRHKRVTGGTQIMLDEFGLTSVILLTQDTVAVGYLGRQLSAMSQRAARGARELTAGRLALVDDVNRRLAALGKTVPRSDEWLGLARARLAECDAQLATQNFSVAYLAADRALRPLRLLERAHWEAGIQGLTGPTASPLTASFATLPDQARFAAGLATIRFKTSDLVGGDFEQMETLRQTGWTLLQHDEPGIKIKSDAELSPDSPHFGRYSLRLRARAASPEQSPGIVETPPVWVISPAVHVASGELVRIQGWVRIPTAIVGSVDGLMAIDSLTGEQLALRFIKTDGWTQFTLYRVAPQAAAVNLTFALTGIGEAWIDDVSIERVMRPRDVPYAEAAAFRSSVGTNGAAPVPRPMGR